MTDRTVRVRQGRYRSGPDNPSWKGDDAGYKALHLRVQQLRGTPSKCERCGRSDDAVVYDWANLTGRYEDPADYERMCRPCHRVFDADRRLVERRGHVAELTAAGASARSIARTLGVTHRTVLKDRRALERLK
jgi:transposase-like protein